MSRNEAGDGNNGVCMLSEELLYDKMFGRDSMSDAVGRDSLMVMVESGCVKPVTRLRLENEARNG